MLRGSDTDPPDPGNGTTPTASEVGMAYSTFTPQLSVAVNPTTVVFAAASGRREAMRAADSMRRRGQRWR
jgi:hypothetical protein